MPADPKPAPKPQLHITVFLGQRGGQPETFNTRGPVELTPARMELLAKLVEPDQWRKNLGSEPTTWEAVEAAVARLLRSN